MTFWLSHFLQHHVAPLQRQFRMLARVIHRRPLDHAHQRGDLLRLQPVERTVEIEIAGQAEAVDRAAGILPEKDLVQIGFEDLVLAVVHLEQQRHQHLVRLARQRAFGSQEKILHQLLGQRAAALDALPGDGLVQRARDAARIDAPVRIEFPVFGRDQRVDQQLGNLVEPAPARGPRCGRDRCRRSAAAPCAAKADRHRCCRAPAAATPCRRRIRCAGAAKAAGHRRTQSRGS